MSIFYEKKRNLNRRDQKQFDKKKSKKRSIFKKYSQATSLEA